MKQKAQSLIEFSIILLFVTIVAIVSLQLISNKINSSGYNTEVTFEDDTSTEANPEEANCTKLGLHWDAQNGVCEAK